MAKALVITPEMQARINAAAGTEVDPTAIAAFECVALTSNPIQKRGSIFEGAIPAPTLFSDLAGFLRENKGVQLMVMHNTDVLPSGRVFHAVATTEGLRAQFYLPNVTDDEKNTVASINNGVVGDVSMGFLAKHLLCSVCSWDYRGPGATFVNLYDRTCGNDHTIGEDGTHLILSGVDSWLELSLVGAGASPGAKIVSRIKASLKNSTSMLESLAASGTDLGAVILSTNPHKEVSMSKELADKIEAQATSIATLTVAKTDLETKLAAAEAKATEAATKLSTVEAELVTAKASEAAVTTSLTAVKAENTSMLTFLTEQGAKAMVVLNLKAEDAPKDAAGLIEKIKAAGVNLANLVAGTGKSQPAKKEADGGTTFLPSAAFSTRRNLNTQS